MLLWTRERKKEREQDRKEKLLDTKQCSFSEKENIKEKRKGGKRIEEKLCYHILKQYSFSQEKERTSFKERKKKRKKERKKERTIHRTCSFSKKESASNAGKLHRLIDFMRNLFIENQTFVYC